MYSVIGFWIVIAIVDILTVFIFKNTVLGYSSCTINKSQNKTCSVEYMDTQRIKIYQHMESWIN